MFVGESGFMEFRFSENDFIKFASIYIGNVLRLVKARYIEHKYKMIHLN